jgi:hypothetical protein
VWQQARHKHAQNCTSFTLHACHTCTSRPGVGSLCHSDTTRT